VALYQCTWRWPGVGDPAERRNAFAEVFVAAEAAEPFGERLRGWYDYPGEYAGFLLVEAESVEKLYDLLVPYSKLMTFDVKPVVSIDYQHVREQLGAATEERPSS